MDAELKATQSIHCVAFTLWSIYIDKWAHSRTSGDISVSSPVEQVTWRGSPGEDSGYTAEATCLQWLGTPLWPS